MNNKIFILLALLLTTGLPAQESHTLSDYIHLGRVNGLSSNTVMSIEDDDLGRIWIGTQKGLNIYDGYHLDRIAELDGSKVNDLHHTPGGMLIASPAFLSYYCYETGRLSKILVDGKYIEYAESFQRIGDDVYFLGDQSLYTIRNGEARRLKEESKATRLAIDKYHAFWMADKSYIYHFDPKLQNSKQYTLGGDGELFLPNHLYLCGRKRRCMGRNRSRRTLPVQSRHRPVRASQHRHSPIP